MPAHAPSLSDPLAALMEMRASIDNIDAALVHMLAERFRQTQAVGRLKAMHGLPPADPGREAAQIARLRRLADEAQLDPDFAEKFLNFIIREVIRHHEMLAAEAKPDALAQGREAKPRIGATASDGLDKDPVLGSVDDLPHQMG
jgi:chorismate mutase